MLPFHKAREGSLALLDFWRPAGRADLRAIHHLAKGHPIRRIFPGPCGFLSCGRDGGSTPTPWTYTNSPPSHPERESTKTPRTERKIGARAPGVVRVRQYRFTEKIATTK